MTLRFWKRELKKSANFLEVKIPVKSDVDKHYSFEDVETRINGIYDTKTFGQANRTG